MKDYALNRHAADDFFFSFICDRLVLAEDGKSNITFLDKIICPCCEPEAHFEGTRLK